MNLLFYFRVVLASLLGILIILWGLQLNLYENFESILFGPNIRPITNLSEKALEFNYNYDNLTARTKIEKDRLFALPYFSGDTLKGLGTFVIDSVKAIEDFNPGEVKCGDIIWVYTKNYWDKTEGLAIDFFKQHYCNIMNPHILISYSEDYFIPEVLHKYFNNSKIIAWYSPHLNAK
jgi:hypothetical protein